MACCCTWYSAMSSCAVGICVGVLLCVKPCWKADHRTVGSSLFCIWHVVPLSRCCAAVTTDATISPGATTSEAEEQALVPALQDVSAEVSISSPEVALDPGREQIRPPGPQLDIERQRNQPVRAVLAMCSRGHKQQTDRLSFRTGGGCGARLADQTSPGRHWSACHDSYPEEQV